MTVTLIVTESKDLDQTRILAISQISFSIILYNCKLVLNFAFPTLPYGYHNGGGA